jgi:hypothetical protein
MKAREYDPKYTTPDNSRIGKQVTGYYAEIPAKMIAGSAIDVRTLLNHCNLSYYFGNVPSVPRVSVYEPKSLHYSVERSN